MNNLTVMKRTAQVFERLHTRIHDYPDVETVSKIRKQSDTIGTYDFNIAVLSPTLVAQYEFASAMDRGVTGKR